MRLSILIIASCLLFSGCTYDREAETLKSPCVGAFGSPCGEKRPVNPHMMHAYSLNS